jgi:hypothetical protein
MMAAMQFRTKGAGLGLLMAALALIGPASAHPQKVAISDVYFNPRSGLIEIAHRFSLHDAEAASRLTGLSEADLIRDDAGRDRFAAYVAAHFVLATDLAPDPLDLELVGHEVDQGYLWIYQQVDAPEGAGWLSLRSDALQEIWPNQVNTVNIRRNERVQTRTLDRTGPTAIVRFPPDTISGAVPGTDAG